MKQRFEIHIGKRFNLELQEYEPMQKINISEDQFMLIERFANIRFDRDLNKIYRLNEVEFIVIPVIKLKEDIKLLAELQKIAKNFTKDKLKYVDTLLSEEYKTGFYEGVLSFYQYNIKQTTI